MELKGLNDLVNSLKALETGAAREVQKEIAATALEMEAEAIRNAPSVYKYSHGGQKPTNNEINQSIRAEKVTPYAWGVSVNSVMGAYAEFGTGAFVDVPNGWEDIAWSYYVNGKGLMMPQPFFIPAFKNAVDKLNERLRKVADNFNLQ